MKSNVSLLAEVCAICNVEDNEMRNKIWDSIQKYNIKDVITYTNFDNSVEAFLNAKECEELSPNTLNNYRNALTLFGEYINDRPAADIEVNDLRSYLLYLKDERGLKKTSIQQYIAILRTFYNWLENEGLLQENNMKQIKSLKIDKTAARHPLTLEDQLKVASKCQTAREKAIYAFFLTTGCRVSEVINIKTNEIDWKNRSVIVLGKGNKYRQVFFTEQTEQLMRKWLEESKNREFLFCTERWPYSPLTKNAMEAIVRKLGQKAELTESLYPHKLRHTFATNCLTAGMDLMVIQKLLGHADPATTQIYAEMNNTIIKEQYDKLVG